MLQDDTPSTPRRSTIKKPYTSTPPSVTSAAYGPSSQTSPPYNVLSTPSRSQTANASTSPQPRTPKGREDIYRGNGKSKEEQDEVTGPDRTSTVSAGSASAIYSIYSMYGVSVRESESVEEGGQLPNKFTALRQSQIPPDHTGALTATTGTATATDERRSTKDQLDRFRFSFGSPSATSRVRFDVPPTPTTATPTATTFLDTPTPTVANFAGATTGTHLAGHQPRQSISSSLYSHSPHSQVYPPSIDDASSYDSSTDMFSRAKPNPSVHSTNSLYPYSSELAYFDTGVGVMPLSSSYESGEPSTEERPVSTLSESTIGDIEVEEAVVVGLGSGSWDAGKAIKAPPSSFKHASVDQEPISEERVWTTANDARLSFQLGTTLSVPVRDGWFSNVGLGVEVDQNGRLNDTKDDHTRSPLEMDSRLTLHLNKDSSSSHLDSDNVAGGGQSTLHQTDAASPQRSVISPIESIYTTPLTSPGDFFGSSASSAGISDPPLLLPTTTKEVGLGISTRASQSLGDRRSLTPVGQGQVTLDPLDGDTGSERRVSATLDRQGDIHQGDEREDMPPSRSDVLGVSSLHQHHSYQHQQQLYNNQHQQVNSYHQRQYPSSGPSTPRKSGPNSRSPSPLLHPLPGQAQGQGQAQVQGQLSPHRQPSPQPHSQYGHQQQQWRRTPSPQPSSATMSAAVSSAPQQHASYRGYGHGHGYSQSRASPSPSPSRSGTPVRGTAAGGTAVNGYHAVVAPSPIWSGSPARGAGASLNPNHHHYPSGSEYGGSPMRPSSRVSGRSVSGQSQRQQQQYMDHSPHSSVSYNPNTNKILPATPSPQSQPNPPPISISRTHTREGSGSTTSQAPSNQSHTLSLSQTPSNQSHQFSQYSTTSTGASQSQYQPSLSNGYYQGQAEAVPLPIGKSDDQEGMGNGIPRSGLREVIGQGGQGISPVLIGDANGNRALQLHLAVHGSGSSSSLNSPSHNHTPNQSSINHPAARVLKAKPSTTSLVPSLVPSAGEEPDAFHVRNTYAQLEVFGVKGDGYEEGVERTRAARGRVTAPTSIAGGVSGESSAPGHVAASSNGHSTVDSNAPVAHRTKSQLLADEAIADVNEKKRELHPGEVKLLSSVDRYGFFSVPTHDRYIVMPSQPFMKPLVSGASSSSSHASTSSSNQPGPSSPLRPAPTSPTKNSGASSSAAHPPQSLSRLPPPQAHPKETPRIMKWNRMLVPHARDEGGNVQAWRVRPSKTNKLRRRVYKGVPDRWRAAVWEMLMCSYGASLEGTENEALAMPGRGHAHAHTGGKGKGKEVNLDEIPQLAASNEAASRGVREVERSAREYRECIEKPSTYDVQIDLDVPRTISGHIMFRTRYGAGQRSLFHVLHAFSLLCPTCGYVQGMGPITATLLSYLPPSLTYTALCRLHTSYNLHSIFSPGFPGLLEAIYVQEQLTKAYIPGVYESLRNNGLSGMGSTSYATKWYITLFAGVVPWQTMLRVWDVFWIEGLDMFVGVAVGILWVYKDQISSPTATFETILSLLSSIFVPQSPQSETEDLFITWIEGMLSDVKVRGRMRMWRKEWRMLVSQGREGEGLA